MGKTISIFEKTTIFLLFSVLFIILLLILCSNIQDFNNFINNDDEKLVYNGNLIVGKSINRIVNKITSYINNQIKDYNNCDETIQIALVCGGFNSTRNFYILLKSILFYRTNPINLHLLVDNNSELILKKMFDSWNVQNLTVNYYDIINFERSVSWIPSQHYSHRFGLIKLDFLSDLADNNELSKLILLDTDMLSIGDIKHVWRHNYDPFDRINNDNNNNKRKTSPSLFSEKPRPIFGMVENQSDWYLRRVKDQFNFGNIYSSVWPALGRGFNSGLILVNLTEFRMVNWRELWREVADKELITTLSAPLADQDIFNAVIKYNQDFVYTLPCTFNIQLNANSKLDDNCNGAQYRKQFQMIHMNSRNKIIDEQKDFGDFYQNMYTTIKNWDGKLLKHGVCFDGQAKITVKNNQETTTQSQLICKDIKPHLEHKLRIHLYYLDYDYQVLENSFDLTFAVHLSFDRLQTLNELADHWPGPISAAIYLSEMESDLFMEMIENSDNLLHRKNIGYHLVYKDYGYNYPTNRLRNIALENTLTPYVVLSDIDLLPSYNLYHYLKLTIANLSSKTKSNKNPLEKRALVIPAFEVFQYKHNFPKNKQELLEQLNANTLYIFREQLWPRGHAPTDYDKWKAAKELYTVQWEPDYEPFIVTSRNVTKFDERFTGFGFNKVEHIMELASENYEFLVLPDAFLIHKYHSASYDLIQHRNSHSYKQCIKHLERLFLTELQTKKPEFFNRLVLASHNQTN